MRRAPTDVKAEQDISTPTPDAAIGIALSAAGVAETELSRSGERIVASDVAEPAEKRGAFVDGGTRELAECVLGSWARHELSAVTARAPSCSSRSSSSARSRT